MIDFPLSKGPFSTMFQSIGIETFEKACKYIEGLPYGRTSNREDLSLVLKEKKGTCSSKHGLLAHLAEENDRMEIELIAGIFMMSPETHPVLSEFFKDKPYSVLPEMHCYFRYKAVRFDFTSSTNQLHLIEPKIVREQRIEPHQVIDWKEKIHQDYLKKWLARKSEIQLTFDEIWDQREKCILLLSQK